MQAELEAARQRASFRYRRLTFAAVATLLSRAIGSLTSFVSVPLTIHYLGTQQYGLWIALSSVTSMLGFADLGMGNGILNSIANADGKSDNLAAQKVVSTGFFVLTAVAVCLVVGFSLFSRVIPYQSFLHLNSVRSSSECASACAVFLVSFALTLPLGIVQRVQTGYQEGFANQLWQSLGNALGLLGILTAIKLRGHLVLLAIGMSGAPLLALTASFIYQFNFRRPWLWPSWRKFEMPLARTIFSNGIYFLALQLASVAIFSADSLIAIKFLGDSATAEYNTVQKLFQVVPLLVGVFSAPLWPAYAEALSRGDLSWVHSTLLKSIVFSTTVAVSISGCLMLLLPRILNLWVGPRFHPSLGLILGSGSSAIVLAATSSIASYLNGSNFIRGQVVVVSIQGILSVALKVFLCTRYGPAGIVWGTVIPYLLVILPSYFWIVPRLLRSQAGIRVALIDNLPA